jgi:hypothetical protein
MIASALDASTGPWMSARQKHSLLWLSAIVGSVLAVLIPALWNGFPFMFYDTGAFIDLAIRGGFMPERSSFYAMFLAAFWPRFSLWPAMFAQVAMCILVMAEFARILTPGLSPLRFFIMVVALCIGTGLPWTAAQILPDILAPLLVLSLYLLGFHGTALSWPRKAALAAVAILAATSHASHLGLAAGLVVAIALMQVATRRTSLASVRPRAALPALILALSLLSLVGSNFARTGDVFISRAGPAFVVGRLVQDGIVKRLLDDSCPQSGYGLCAYKDRLPKNADDYLWGSDSPFDALGGFAGTAVESTRIITESLKNYPLLHLKMAILDTLEQLITFETGDGIEPLNDVPVPAMERYIPEQMEGYRESRQQNDEIGFRWINALHVPVGALSVIALAAILVRAILLQNWNDRVFLPVFLLTALLGNAFICGVLSNPHDRYQSRLMWMVCFVVLLLTTKQLSRLFFRIGPLGELTVLAKPAVGF